MSFIDRFIKPVYAHCDVPCGIYETDTMQHAADTCLRMIEKIEALEDHEFLEVYHQWLDSNSLSHFPLAPYDRPDFLPLFLAEEENYFLF